MEQPINEPGARELSGAALFWHRLRNRIIARLSRHIPRLVWPGQEIDVRITFKDLGALSGSDGWGLLGDADGALHDLGICFDTGSGSHGRDWEWDWSLSGPISVTFRDHAKHPERRMAVDTPKPPKLRLVS